jgi:hypothetical protein
MKPVPLCVCTHLHACIINLKLFGTKIIPCLCNIHFCNFCTGDKIRVLLNLGALVKVKVLQSL